MRIVVAYGLIVLASGLSSKVGYSGLHSTAQCPISQAFLEHAPVGLKALRAIIPLGEMGPSSHTLPVHHLYFNLNPLSEADFSLGAVATKLLAPVAADIMAVEWDTSKNDWKIHLKPCEDVSIYMGHVQWLHPSVLNAIGSMAPADVAVIGSKRIKAVDIAVTSGQWIGTAGGPEVTSLDVGLVDLSRPAHAFVNPARYDIEPVLQNLPLPPNMTEALARQIMPQRLYQFCAIDYYPPPLKQELEAKLGSFMGQQPAAGSPLCQTQMRDVAGTMAGNWFISQSESQLLMNEKDALTASVYNVDPTLSVLSLPEEHFSNLPFDSTWGFSGSVTGNTNRKFETVNDNAVYCFSNLKRVNGPEELSAAILMQLGGVGNSQLKVEVFSDHKCSTLPTWQFTGAAVTYYR
jgi:hypothetical protein